jgi:formate dehydrogenase major subunit
MTNHWNDIQNSDYVMVIGANPAENHPVAFRHVSKALVNNGTKLIVVDPRYTRTASKAHFYAPMRSGTDIAFVDGLINHVIGLGPSSGGKPGYNQDYVLWYSNAGFLLKTDFKGPKDQPPPFDGLFSGYQWSGTSPGKYDKASWGYAANAEGLAVDIGKDFWDAEGNCKAHGAACPGGWKRSVLTLEGPKGLAAWRQHLAEAKLLPANGGRTVWEELKRHMARYTPGLVSSITGCPHKTLKQVYGQMAKSGAPGKSAVIMYAMGATQHTHGTQNIRAYSILQTLLGNMGVAGGGIAAMRGESNVQGSTDFALLFHILPGYLPVPDATQPNDATVPGYLNRTVVKKAHAGEVNWWGNRTKYFVSYLANMWNDLGVASDAGHAAYSDPNGVAHKLPPNIQEVYERLPKIPGNCSWISLWERMAAGGIKGLLCFGQNPAVSSPNAKVAREALRKLDWLVVSELWEQETAAFWQHDLQGDKLDDAGMAAIQTEVFLLPAAAHLEKDGSISNSGRWVQFRYRADGVEPPGNKYTPGLGARHEIKTINALYDQIRGLCADPQIQTLNLGTHWYGTDDPLPDVLDAEINGYARSPHSVTFGAATKNYVPGNLIDSFAFLSSTGASACANWIECNIFTGAGWASAPPGHGAVMPAGTNKAKNRNNAPGAIKAYAGWAWCWPVNRRIIYNRASVRPRSSEGIAAGRPWDPGHPVLTYECKPTADGFVAPWSAENPTSWVCNDVIDGGFVKSEAGPVKSPLEIGPFIMQNEGHARLFGGFSLTDGPLPEHYEPLENPFGVPDIQGRGANPMGHGQLVSPAAKIWRLAEVGEAAKFPVVCTTYRVTEHWQAGAQTRNLPWLCELTPGVFCEMSCELAAAKNVKNGDQVRVASARGEIECLALVTDRFKPFKIKGKVVHQIGVIWHFGYKGLAVGHSANLLTQHVGCANTMIPEYKAFRCRVTKA